MKVHAQNSSEQPTSEIQSGPHIAEELWPF